MRVLLLKELLMDVGIKHASAISFFTIPTYRGGKRCEWRFAIMKAKQRLSIGAMERWLYDVMETERRILVLDDTIEKIDGVMCTAGQYQKAPEPSYISPYGSIPEWVEKLVKYILLIAILLVSMFVTAFCLLYIFHISSSMGGLILGILLIPGFFIALFIAEELELKFEEFVGGMLHGKKNKELRRKWENENVRRETAALETLALVPQMRSQKMAFVETRNNLVSKRKQLYGTCYLDSAYHGFVPVAAMYGYLKTGRCTTIYGHGGVVDTYVHDQQFALLNSKLDTIISKIDDIRHTQAALANAIKKNNDDINRLRQDIDRFASQQHSDNQKMIECQRYTNECLNWILSARLYA